MPKIDIAKAVVRTKGVYPGDWRKVTDGREKAALGSVAGLTQFGVNLTRLTPALRRFKGLVRVRQLWKQPSTGRTSPRCATLE